ncbi:MAG: EamA family transporter [Bacteroidetes bacterium 4572_114]|nr:MAG: EamA family transporter [Bacteroidetes bacterium 4572_114]
MSRSGKPAYVTFATEMPANIKAHIALLGASIIFGINYWVAKGLMPDYLCPEQIVFLRIAGAFLLFFFFSLFAPSEKVEKRDLWRIIIAGFFGTALNQYLFFKGLNLTTPVDVAIIHVSNPIFTLVFAIVLIRERVTFLKAIGILLGATGAVVLILYSGNISLSSDTFTGNLLALLNTLAYAVYLVLIKPMMVKYKPFTVMKWVFFVGFVFCVPATLPSMLEISFATFNTSTWLSLVYVVVATTFLAYLLTIFSLKYVEASVASYYIYLQPFIASVIAFWLGKQDFTFAKGLAATLIFVGVYFVSRKRGTG